MNYLDTINLSRERLKIRSLLPKQGINSVRKEILDGLNASTKSISSKFFYNSRGSKLYEQITLVEEYYPYRTELAILMKIAPGLMQSCQDYDVIELGPGDPSKISILLKAADMQQKFHYLPMDISESAIRTLSELLIRRFPLLEIDAWVLDFTKQFGLIRRESPALICFFGSTIGNLNRNKAKEFLRKLTGDMKEGDHLLVGMDLVKPEDILYAAYNDKKGITAEFNLNILSSVNHILNTNFQKEDFRHLAFYNRQESRVEMHLEATRSLQVESPLMDRPVRFEKGERIHTENSHKFSTEQIHEFADICGLDVENIHTDKRQWFALAEFVKS